MKGKLMATGGVLIAGAALFCPAGAAEAALCELGISGVSRPVCDDYETWYRTVWGRDPHMAGDPGPVYLDRHPSRPPQPAWVIRWGSPGWSARRAWDDGG
ncbi:hypothetical protein [Nonomuraea helvata]|uniref:Secreted protein n=1 Tax=Nonomuraea helvata TaxID=37484 RepID=A0ABV5SKW0_9ACTN